MIRYVRSTSEEELLQIVQLQQRNLAQAVSEVEQKTEGFLTVQHDLPLLKSMHDACPHTLAKDGDTVVGYALSMHPIFGDQIEVLKPMFQELRRYANYENYIVMGQICIDRAHRKQGIFRSLYQFMKAQLVPTFSAIITEVHIKNERSLQAHNAVGFGTLGKYTASEQEWVLLKLE